MGTHTYIPLQRKGTGLCVLAIIMGVLFACQLLMPSAVFAEHRVAAASDPAFPDKQGASVVRLLVSYSKQGNTAAVSCTGLGVFVGSWTVTGSNSPDDLNTWILTDRDLLNQDSPSCSKNGGPISNVTVFASNSYTNPFNKQNPANPQLASVDLSHSAAYNKILFVTNSQLALLPYHSTAPVPYLSLDASDKHSQTCLDLSSNGSASAEGTVPATPEQAQSSLSVNQVSCAGSIIGTSGMPIFNAESQLIGLNTDKSNSGWSSTDELKTYLTDKTDKIANKPLLLNQPANLVKQAWETGMDQYAARNFQEALVSFKSILPLNPGFTGAAQYADSAAGMLTPTPSPAKQKAVPPPPTPTSASGKQNLAILLLAGVGLLVLALLVIFVSIHYGRRRRELALFKKEQLEADRIAEQNLMGRDVAESEVEEADGAENQRDQDMREREQAESIPVSQAQMPQHSGVLPPAQYAAQGGAAAPAVASSEGERNMETLSCPNCGQQVARNVASCPNCGILLSPSDSGIQRRAAMPPEYSGYNNNLPSPMPPPPYEASPTLVAPGSISDQKTVVFPKEAVDPAQSPTQPYLVQQMQGRNLSLVVGTLSDPGIKRQHKPNEDSLFALQGARQDGQGPQQFGLFVVADGMGGHANGRDASRLAIQTIINTLLPRLCSTPASSDEDYRSWLADGVQKANEAVFKRNQEHRADAGTTMTAALVVGSTAYVANVGDSRTYIYREPGGLRKITNDHSVVASLVEAGIIKPDDIYTHPKRHQIYRSLGEKIEIEIDTFVEHLQPGDKLLLCSDGLWDMVRDPVIQRVMAQAAPSPDQTGTELVKAAYEGGGEDNVSVIVVYITEETQRTGKVGVQVLAQPDSVTIPDLPQM